MVVSGGGNNGGDGFVIARELHRSGTGVAVLATKSEYEGDPATNLEALRNLGVRLIEERELDAELRAADLVVDALLGTGFSGEVREREAGIIEQMNSAEAAVLAVDVPSGVDGATGEVQGVAVYADLTVCAHAAKVGCVISPGREHSGEVVAVDIGIPPEADVDPSLLWTDAASLRGKIPRTAEPAHKYSAGALLVVAGSRGMTGAPVMVVHGAQRTGCGIVFLATSEGAAPAVDLALTEALVYGVPEDDEGYMGSDALEEILGHAERASALVMGPGTGTGDDGRRLVEGILREVEVPVLLDADAITNLAGTEVVSERDNPDGSDAARGGAGAIAGIRCQRGLGPQAPLGPHGGRGERCCVLLKGSDTLVVEGRERRGQLDGRGRAGHGGDRGRFVRCDRGAPLPRDGHVRGRQGRSLGARPGSGTLDRGDRLACGEHGGDRFAGVSSTGRRGAALSFRLLFVGDVVGPAGCAAALDLVPRLREELDLDAVVANAENSAPAGRGITRESGSALLSVADFLTLGNHAFDAEGYREFLEEESRVVRPANFGEKDPGLGWGLFQAGGVTVGVTNVLGRVFVERTKMSPFEAADRAVAELESRGADLVLVDSHAEATSEKLALGHYLDGRAQAVLGTHTHVPTADLSMLTRRDGVRYRRGHDRLQGQHHRLRREDFLALFLGDWRGISVATRGPVVFNAALVEFDLAGGRAVGVEAVRREWKP